MVVEFRTGDLFKQEDVEAIGHGVNCKGKMGSGIAVLFRNKFPAMHRTYVKVCADGRLRGGSVFPWLEKGPTEVNGKDLWIYNISSQILPGANATYPHLIQGMDVTLRYMRRDKVTSIALPEIGCGIGGLEFAEVKQIFKDRYKNIPEKIIFVSLPDPEEDGASSEA